jgi:hypothetical protein
VWQVAWLSPSPAPAIPHVTIPRHRHRRPSSESVVLHWAHAPAVDAVTTPLRTLVDCARTLSFGPAPAIADSPARARSVSRAELLAPLVGSWAVRVAALYSGSPSIWTDAASRFSNRYCERC